MGCGNCGSSSGHDGKPAGCNSNGGCSSGGCNKLNTYDWFRHMAVPEDYQPFNVVEVRFKGSRKEFYRNEDGLNLFSGDAVVVESDYGHDLGHVALSGELVRLQLKKRGVPEDAGDIRKIYRIAGENDLTKYREFKDKEPATLERARTIALDMRLQMKISDIEFQGDGRKVIFFYTAEERVDFRELIRRYAAEFKTRIEMRQVGYREEASRLGGIGSCGRELCCSTWLTDFKVVSMGAAKTQNLSINMLKLSGQCGRLKCCLNFELETYLDALKAFPKGDRVMVKTERGRAFLQKTDILQRMLWFSYEKSSDWTAITLDRTNEILEMNARGEMPESLIDLAFATSTLESIEPPADLISDQSLTRLDDKNKPRKKPRKKGKGRPNTEAPRADFRKPKTEARGGNPTAQAPKNQNKPQGQGPGQGANKNRSKRRRPNRPPNNPGNKPKE